MSKTVSIALKSHFAQGSTTTAFCWKAIRRDGFVLAVTTCARDLLFEGTLYLSKDGFNPKAISQEASAAVTNTEVEGALSDEITEEDFEVGKWDGCAVEMFEVNYRDLSMGKLALATFTLGDCKLTRGQFNAEVRGLTQSLQKQIGEVVTKSCRYRFGDPNTCRVDLAPLTVTGSIDTVVDLRTFSDSARAEPDDYFSAGVLTWETGANQGVSMEVYSYAADGTITLHLPMWLTVSIGDTYSLTPGCRKRYTEDCREKWSNTNNFGGFPLLPGPDKVLGLGGTEGSNL